MWQKTAEELRQALSAPFGNSDIEWRVSATNHEKTKGLAVPYVTNRAIQNRLDDTVGIDGWYNDFTPWKEGKAQLCGISIYFTEQNLWLTKWDGADDSDIESVKGGLSDSMKRAAVEWGIGRYLYGMTQDWVAIEQRGKGFFIADGAWSTLDQAHENWVRKLQGKPVPQSGAPQGTPKDQKPQPKDAGQQKPAPAPSLPDGCYLVRGAVLKPTLSGKSRTSVQLQNGAGQCFQAYTQGPDQRLAPGIVLANVKLSTRSKDGVTFYILDAYEIAASSAQPAA
ncbi:MAG: hypothetical protein HFF18_06275 [Oscillospiraceae bacterium]|nr:hypothetical protein [Oscillospiraceae bacterium]